MLAMYFALLDSLKYLTVTKHVKRTFSKNFNMQIRSDSKSTIEQLIGKCEIKDALIQRIYVSINRLLHRIPQLIKFSHVKRSRNIAGILLNEKRRRKGGYSHVYDIFF
jgi:ribosomal protein L1